MIAATLEIRSNTKGPINAFNAVRQGHIINVHLHALHLSTREGLAGSSSNGPYARHR